MMQEKLIVYLHNQDLSRPSWIIIDAHGGVQQRVSHGDPEAMMLLAYEKEIFVIVPAEDVLLTKVVLPDMSRARILQAIPYALEEQLIAEVDQLHFALGGKIAESEWAVAVVAREKMQTWMSCLESWHLHPAFLIPATLTIPYSENVWSILITEIAMIRTDPFLGFACEITNLTALVELALKSGSSVPGGIRLYQDISTELKKIILAYNLSIEEHFISPEEVLVLCGSQVANHVNINLLQGAYTPKQNIFSKWNKLIAGLGIIWIGLLFLTPLMSYYMLHHRLQNIDQQIMQIYKRHFKNATSLVAPKLRMEEKLQQLTSGVSDNRIYILLVYLSVAIKRVPEMQLKHLEYQNNQMTVEVLAPSSEKFSLFTQSLIQKGLKVRQQNASVSGTVIHAAVQIE